MTRSEPNQFKPDPLVPGEHLTDEQFATCLDGSPLGAGAHGELEAHLSRCAPCRAELELFQSSLDDFSTAAMAWSRTQPVPSLRPLATARPRRQPVPAPLQWAVAATLLLGIAIPIAEHRERAQPGSESAAAVPGAPSGAPAAARSGALSAAVNAVPDSPAEIAQDNDLLKAVNLALGSNDPSPIEEYRLSSGPDHRRASHSPLRAQ